MIKTCVIPAAGKGSRWAPISGYLPKEMLPLVNKPVTEWVAEEVASSGCKKIIVVINKSKEIIKKHLLANKNLTKKANFEFVYQNKPLGVAHAIWLCKKAIGENDFGVALPDLPTLSRVPALLQLTKHHKSQTHIASIDKFPRETRNSYTECLLEKSGERFYKIKHFCPKVSQKKPHHPNVDLRMSGRFVFSSNIWPIVEELAKKLKSNEITDVDMLNSALEDNQEVYAVRITGHTYDTGTPKNYVRANSAFFKKELR